MNIIEFIGAKGGVGTSTVAMHCAAAYAKDGSTVDVWDPSGDVRAMSVSNAYFATRSEGLFSLFADVIVSDGPIPEHWKSRLLHPSSGDVRFVRVLVTDNSYLSLRRATAHTEECMVVVMDSSRPLNAKDVNEVLGPRHVVATISCDDRAKVQADAGILPSTAGANFNLALLNSCAVELHTVAT